MRSKLLATLISSLFLAACVSNLPKPSGQQAADPNNPSPTAGGDTSQKANEMAEKAMYKPIEYQNAHIQGPKLVVIPGEIKSNNATFTQKFGPNNIADFAELELGRANFTVLERSDLGPLLQEFQLAYSMGDPNAARKLLQKGKLKATKWVVKFDILKAEQVAQAQQGFDGRDIAALIQTVQMIQNLKDDEKKKKRKKNTKAVEVATAVFDSVKTAEGSGVWIIGMRYKILDASTTEQVATGYTEEKMEVGAKSVSVLGVSQSAQGGLTLDGMVQRLVEKLVYEIDEKYKNGSTGKGNAQK